jgi:hypothetical protein
MIDQLILTFCHIDDFCIIYDKGPQSKSINNKKKKTGLKPSLSLSEIMTILIMYQAVRYKDFKTYYVEFIKIYWKHYFPTSSSYNRFVELIDIAMSPLIAFILSNDAKHTNLYFIDVTKLPVCHNLRESRHRVFNGLAAKGKTSNGWFFGFKLHLLTNHIGEIVSINISPGNKDDRSFLTKLCKGRLVFGDRGYISKDKAKILDKQGLKLITTLKKNMKKVPRTRFEKAMLAKRSIIETIFDYLKNNLTLWHTRHRSINNAFTHLMAALAQFIISPIKINNYKYLEFK